VVSKKKKTSKERKQASKQASHWSQQRATGVSEDFSCNRRVSRVVSKKKKTSKERKQASKQAPRTFEGDRA
jgi:hypothetical protein